MIAKSIPLPVRSVAKCSMACSFVNPAALSKYKDGTVSSEVTTDCWLRKAVTEVRFLELIPLLWYRRDDAVRRADVNRYAPLLSLLYNVEPAVVSPGGHVLRAHSDSHGDDARPAGRCV